MPSLPFAARRSSRTKIQRARCRQPQAALLLCGIVAASAPMLRCEAHENARQPADAASRSVVTDEQRYAAPRMPRPPPLSSEHLPQLRYNVKATLCHDMPTERAICHKTRCGMRFAMKAAVSTHMMLRRAHAAPGVLRQEFVPSRRRRRGRQRRRCCCCYQRNI